MHAPATNLTSELDTEGTWERSTYTLKPGSAVLNASHTRDPPYLIRNKTRQNPKKLLQLSNFLKRAQTNHEDNGNDRQNMTYRLIEKH